MPDTTCITSAPPITCPRCHKGLNDLPTESDAKCPKCGLDLFFAQSTAENSSTEFRGWLPRKVGPYDISAFVAQGDTGIVVRGMHREKQVPAAITLIRMNLDADSRERFVAEVEMRKKLKHPNVLTPLDHGQDQDMLWLAIDWIEGQSLATRIASANEKDEPIALVEIQQTMQRVRDGLEYLHTKGIIHRDLRPANVLIARDGSVKIVDIGTQKTSNIAPEQLDGKPASTSSDVFCFGLIWYEMLTGQPRGTPPQTPTQVRPETPLVWNNAILKCLLPIPANRVRLHNIKSILCERPTGATVKRTKIIKKKTPKVAGAPSGTPGLVKFAVCLGAVWLAVWGVWRGRPMIARAWESMHAAKPATTPVREAQQTAKNDKAAVVDAKPAIEVKPIADATPKTDVKPVEESKSVANAKPSTDAKANLEAKDLSYSDLLVKAKAEDVAAMTELGLRYQHGTAEARLDPEMGRKWLRAAATRGHFPAMLALANAERDLALDESINDVDRAAAAREADLWYGKLKTTVGVPTPNYLAALLGARELHKHFGAEIFTADTTDTSTDTTR
jgi:serine/threonine protein kinase